MENKKQIPTFKTLPLQSITTKDNNLIKTTVVIVIFFLTCPIFAGSLDPKCIKWFQKSKMDSPSCEIDCTILPVDMGTFLCHDQCELLCTHNTERRLVYYPGLTQAEQRLIKENPLEALIVFIQKNRAESSTTRNFPDQGINDESDAFRHFVWASLLTKELGLSRSKTYLNAHEEDPAQPQNEREMDLFNNELGMQFAEEALKTSDVTLEKIEKEGLTQLQNKKLKVLKPGLFIPKEPKK